MTLSASRHHWFPGAQPRCQIWGPIPWSRLLYRTKYGWYTQFRIRCSLLRNGNHTLPQKSWGGPSKFWGVRTPRPPAVAPLLLSNKKYCNDQPSRYANNMSIFRHKYLQDLSIADMGDRLATINLDRKVCGEAAVPLSVERELGPHLTLCRLGRGLPPYQVAF